MRLILGVVAASLALLAPPTASSAPIATLTAESPISAGHHWLVWSAPGPGGWILEGFHEGRVQALPPAPRAQPFDADVGSDAHGAPVVTYSRCRVTPAMEDAGLYVGGTGTLVEPNTGAGCRVRVLELDSGKEWTPPIPEPRGISDTSPAMWRGTVVFARKAPGHGRVSQIMLWAPRHPTQLLDLPHGAVPEGCPPQQGCKERPVGGEAQAMSLDSQLVAFVWRPEGPDTGDGAWEERVDNLAGNHGTLAGSLGLTESCTGDNPVEEEWPAPPLLLGSAALFPELERGGCYTNFQAALFEYQEGNRFIGTFSSPIVEMARDGATTYALVAQKPTSEQDPGCSVALPCSLEFVTPPMLRPSRYKPTHPFDY